MILPIPKETTFECPEGPMRATVHDIRDHLTTTETGAEKQVRVIFQVQHARPDRKLVLVGKSYPATLAKGSRLRDVLANWLGDEFFNQAGHQLDLKTLVNREADIVTRHCHNPAYKHPYVDLVGVYPPGTLTTSTQSGIGPCTTLYPPTQADKLGEHDPSPSNRTQDPVQAHPRRLP